jgi:outer membrane receptor protein involved in Fe transport
VRVEPETGHNVDIGARWRGARVAGSAAYFVNTYDGFISTEVVSESQAGSISQAINLAKVRIQGVEGEANATLELGALQAAPWLQAALTRGTVLEGVSPLSGDPLDGAPQDNITPWKVSAGVQVRTAESPWWAGYHVRAQGDVTRVSPLLSESPFLIAQDLFALDGFAVHRIAAGYDWRVGAQRVGVTLAVDNLTDAFYREHFQFAPARGRSFTVAVNVLGVQ